MLELPPLPHFKTPMLSGFWAPTFCHNVMTNKMTATTGLFYQKVYLSSLRDNKMNKYVPHLHFWKKKMLSASREGADQELCSWSGPRWRLRPHIPVTGSLSPYELPTSMRIPALSALIVCLLHRTTEWHWLGKRCHLCRFHALTPFTVFFIRWQNDKSIKFGR